MIIIGFESSCDETGVAIASTENGLLAHALHSQIAMHKEYGGVVPELASRDHIKRIVGLTEEVFKQTSLTPKDLDAVAYTAGPGLAGALLVGAGFANSFAWANNLPAIAIHHLEGHLLSPLLADEKPNFPFIALLVSGGHTQIMRVDAVGKYELLGETLDDAAGEAFDKSAKLLGLPYPGGPELAKLALDGDPEAYNLPRPMLHSKDLDFSFSGLKTAVLTQMQKLQSDDLANNYQARANLAASTQAAIVDVLVKKSIQAIKDTKLKNLVVAGGVGANLDLRKRLNLAMQKLGGKAYFPPMKFCTDNGAMIAWAAVQRANAGLLDLACHDKHGFAVRPRWDLHDICVNN